MADQEHYRCSKYKSNRGECSIHYIREQVLTAIVLKAVQELAEFVQEFEPVFLYLMEKKKTLAQKQEISEIERKVKKDRERIAEIDQIISCFLRKISPAKSPTNGISVCPAILG